MKARANISVGDWYKSGDVEIESASESDVRFAKTVLSSIAEIKEKPTKITLDVDGRAIKKAVEEAFGSAFSDDKR